MYSFIREGDDSIRDNQLLRDAIENGILDAAEIRERCEMAKQKAILAKHPYTISQTKDGQWTTHYLDGGTRKQIKRKSKTDVEKILAKRYEEMEENPTLEELFQKAQNDKRAYDHKKESTLTRNQWEYSRFFSDFGKNRIKDIDSLDIENFLRDCRRKNDMSKKGFNSLLGVMRMILNQALVDRYIDFDVEIPIKRASLLHRSSFRDTRKEDSEEVFSPDELKDVEEELLLEHSVYSLGAEILLLTGMRIGEALALKWEDYDPEKRTLHIHRTETQYYVDGKFFREVSDSPKTFAGNRIIPVLSKLEKVLSDLRGMNLSEEYILFSKNNRVNAEQVRRALKRACNNSGIPYRSPHKLRKTYASYLATQGVPPKIITELMGHEDYQVTQTYYIKKYATLEQKESYLQKAFGN